MQGRDMLAKLRELPEERKKLIVWGVTIVVGIGVLLWWARGVQEDLSAVGESANSAEENTQWKGLQEQLESSAPEGAPSFEALEGAREE